ncbi:MAG: hypothetical protein COB15_02820 [Flavobacteriales bacterium]|nr:MAG: hypothetical protein COB15_02820 [Flavobacteriales bacterium]
MKYSYHPKSILRTPSKPIKTSFNRKELIELYLKKDIQEALFLSSPNLLNEFIKWQKGEITDKVDEKRLINSLLKYALRMHNRCTPFGLFAACGTTDTGRHDIIINSKKERSTRLDMNFSCALAQELTKLPFIKKHLKFYPNTSIYKLQDKIRYIEYFYKNKSRTNQISSVDSSFYLNEILNKSKKGASIEELAQSIVQEDINIENALEFVNQVVEAQLLVSELEPAVIGEELLNQILRVLINIQQKEEIQELSEIIKLLQVTQKELIQIDKKIGNSISVYEKLSENLNLLNIPFELGKLFQTDLYLETNHKKPIRNNDSHLENLNNGLKKAIEVLNQLTSKPKETNLKNFRDKFYSHFEDKEIPLLEALDSESGLGYGHNNNHTVDVNPLINNLTLPNEQNSELKISWNGVQSFLFQQLLKSKDNEEQVINLKIDDLKDFKSNWDDLPESFSIMYNYLGKREGSDLFSIESIGGTSATYLLGRFASNNKEIEQLVREIANTEQENNPHVIFAEIAHLPESRTGNVLMRPTFRNYEIPYLSNSTLSKEQQIRVNDLFISIKNNRVILRSKRLNKEIIPRLGNAHNYSFKALPVYHFLCDLQGQNLREGLYFSWGDLSNEFDFLPRVEVENVIISPATWQLIKNDFEILLKKDNQLDQNISTWREKWKLPEIVLLADGDNKLVIDFQNKLSREMFISIIRKRQKIILKEFLFDKKNSTTKDQNGNMYTNEFISILQKTTQKENADFSEPTLNRVNAESKVIENQINLQREFSLGSEWLYYKLYCGVKIGDKILTEVIKPLSQQLINEGLIDSWFFIRYADPEIHLRVRFHFRDINHVGKVLSLFHNSIKEYQQNRLIWKIQTDTYQREIGRYGKRTMVISESLFHIESNCIVNMIDMLEGDEGEEIRWKFAIKAIDTLLTDFNFNFEKKRNLLESLKDGFATEFNMNKRLKMQLDKKFRIHRKDIAELFNNRQNVNKQLAPLFVLLENKSRQSAPFNKEILKIHKENKLDLSLNNLLSSYIHMLLNRIFKNKQRVHEMVIYDFMWRTYRSELAKQKQLQKELVV